jgi:dTMP kinase
MKQASFFLSFEGIEGCGKTTQIKKISEYFKKNNYNILETKEPGGTTLGLKLREILLDKNCTLLSKYSEILLFTVDRLEHLEQKIKPALAEGKIVITDRYIDSTIAYQQGARKIPENIVKYLNGLVEIKPNLTILLDIKPEIGLKRIINRSQNNLKEPSLKDNRFESQAIDFHNNVRAQYLALAVKEPKRIKVINAEDSAENIFSQIIAAFMEKYNAL